MAKHRNPRTRDRTSLAPYNFVALPKRVYSIDEGARSGSEQATAPWRAQDRYLDGTHSGWIDLELTAETPLYVRCAPPVAHAADEDVWTNRHRQDFFHHGDPAEPVIPGSSLRGMTRALVEILGFGAFRWFTDRQLIYRAVGDETSLGDDYRLAFLGPDRGGDGSRKVFDYPVDRVRGGYLRLRGGERYIQPARRVHGETLVHVEDAAASTAVNLRLRSLGDRSHYGADDVVPVWLQPPTGRESHVTGGRQGVELKLARVREATAIRRRGEKDRAPAGFVPATLVRSGGAPRKHMHCAIYEPDRALAKPEDWIKIEHDLWSIYKEDRELTRGIQTRKLKDDGDPLFYLVDEAGELIFFGPTLMFRLPYTRPISDFVPPELHSPETLDLAEAIFGTVDRKPAIKGRVFFEDALWQRRTQSEDPFLEPGDAGLRSPKILSGPKPTSFQHYLAQPQPDSEKTLKHWASKPDETEIRGHKRYWHKRGNGEAEGPDPFERTVSRDSQHTVIRPVRKGTRFAGRVRFENLTDVELGALLTALDLPPSKRHHVGMGKPLGMGSTRIEAGLHLVDRHERYARLVTGDGAVETGEVEDERAKRVGERARTSFETTILKHVERSGEVDKAPRTLWEIPRLAELGALLEWDDAPPAAKTGYKRPEDEHVPFPPFWKDRCVLPDPGGVLDRPRGGAATGRRGETDPPVKKDPLQPGTVVQAVVLEEKTKKGGWRFQLKGTELNAVLHPQSPEPADLEPGRELQLKVKAGGTTPQLTWEGEGKE